MFKTEGSVLEKAVGYISGSELWLALREPEPVTALIIKYMLNEGIERNETRATSRNNVLRGLVCSSSNSGSLLKE